MKKLINEEKQMGPTSACYPKGDVEPPKMNERYEGTNKCLLPRRYREDENRIGTEALTRMIESELQGQSSMAGARKIKRY